MMNCESFQDLLYEYLDDTLDPENRSEARLHLQQCGSCRRILMGEQAFSDTMRQSLTSATEGLTVRSGMRQDIMDALEAKRRTGASWLAVLAGPRPLLPALTAAAVLGVGLVLFEGVIRRSAGVANIPGEVSRDLSSTWVVDVPIQTQRHVFQRQQYTVVDSMTEEMSGAHLSIDSGAPDQKSSPTPL